MKTGQERKEISMRNIQIYLVLNEDPIYVKLYLLTHPSGAASSHQAPGR